MTPNKKILAGGIALVALAAGAVAASAHRGMGGMGFGGHRGHGLMGAVCSGNGAEMADHLLVSIEYKVKPTDAQKPAFEELKSAARAAAAKAKTACPPEPVKAADGTKTEPPKKTPVDRLAMMEARLTAELEAVKTVRPAAEKFYASLTDDQKKSLAEREHRRGGWGSEEGRGGPGGPDGHWRHHRGPDDDRSGPQDGTPPPAGKQ